MSDIARREVTCPKCGHEFTIAWRMSITPLKPKRHWCPNCDFVGTREDYKCK